MKYLVLLLLIFPFIEIYTLIVVGGSIGALNAVLLILLTGLIGAYLLRNKGIKTLLDIKSNKKAFEPSADNFLKTLFTPIGGFLLLVPGFITDFMGILILLPLTRIFILGLFFSYLGSLNQKVNANRQSEDWIEGEYKKDK
jgi:UPF0716 protein FxsA|tara:strand:+ start:1642 stop:2064 length:423 start_codon:yes stop_codon:yes gene_type:complete